MNYNKIKYCLKAAEVLNFSEAARQMYVTPQSFGRQISILEREMGFALFDRSTRKIELTASGKIVYENLSGLVKSLEKEYQKMCEMGKLKEEMLNTCGCFDMEWTQISGKAKMKSLMMLDNASSEPENADLMPYCLAAVTIEEGADVKALVQGVTWEDRDRVYAQLPADVHAKIAQRDGYKTVVFELDEI